MPVAARADRVRQFDERGLAFESDDAVQFGDDVERLLITQAGKVPAHGEVAADPAGAQRAHQRSVTTDVELEDEGKPDQDRVQSLGGPDDLLGILLDIHDADVVAALPQHGRQIAEAKISLVLKADEHDRARRIAPVSKVSVILLDCA